MLCHILVFVNVIFDEHIVLESDNLYDFCSIYRTTADSAFYW